MTARALLRAVASRTDCAFPGCDQECVGHVQAKALRALADRMDAEEKAAAKAESDAQHAGDERMETIAYAKRNLLARLDAPLEQRRLAATEVEACWCGEVVQGDFIDRKSCPRHSK
jgi:hypothetical protein